jgi:CRP/FNR family transcriptional regulator, cyclic AMP receptor protein
MNNQRFADLLSWTPAFQCLNADEINTLVQASTTKHIHRHNFAYMQDEKASDICFVLQGTIKIGAFAADGREVAKEILQTGSMFGDLSLVGESLRNDFALAMHADVEVCFLPTAIVREMMNQNQRFMHAILVHLSQRLQRVEDRLAKLIVSDARERIIEFLVDSANREGRQVGFETLVQHKLTQQEIASLTGTSRQTVTSVLNDLKKSNLIHFNRKSFLIRDLQKLA